MDNQTDQQLLRDYAELKSDAAFAELVRRHIDFVYSAALRMVRDSHLAEDVTQAVFLGLAQNAPKLTDRAILSGWLHRTTQNLAANVVRSDVRRRAREQEAATMNELLANETDPGWKQVAPHLDAALGELNETDRDAVLMRYFERKSAREMAAILGGSEEAAQKRVTRAVERLRELFTKRGVALGAGGLATAISTNAVQAAPVGLAATIASAASLAGVATATSTTAAATKAIAMTTLQKTIFCAAIVAVVVTPLATLHNRDSLRAENHSLQQQLASLQSSFDDLSNRVAFNKKLASLRLPAPQVQAMSSPEDSNSTNRASLYTRFKDRSIELSPQQIEPYLKANGRNAASLLAAYRTTGDIRLLQEAMQRFPDDPQVAFEAALHSNFSPAEKRQWLEAMKKFDPDNALPNYLVALDYFKSGQTDLAVRELTAANAKSQFREYTQDRAQEDEDAFLGAGYNAAEAKTIACSQLQLPQLQKLKDLALTLGDLAKSYRQSGDDASAQAALQMVVSLGQRYDGSPGVPEVSWLVGMAIERIALGQMDPSSSYGGAGQTVQDRLSQIQQKRDELRKLSDQFETIAPTLSDLDWMSYNNRWRSIGEESALRWAVAKYSQK